MTQTQSRLTHVRSILKDLSFPMHLSGYWLLCVAISLYAQNPNISMTKELYPVLAQQFDRDPESAIRRVILYAWEHGSREVWQEYLPHCHRPPSNLVFIATIAGQLR